MNGQAAINCRILVVDEVQSHHDDLHGIFESDRISSSARSIDEFSFVDDSRGPIFQVCSTTRGSQALELLEASQEEGERFQVAFIGVTPESNWSGLAIATQILRFDAEILVVLGMDAPDIVSTEELERIGEIDRIQILKFPFGTEARFTALSLLARWHRQRALTRKIEADLEYVEDADRVVGIVERCLEEFEQATLDLRRRADELERTLQARTDELFGTRDLTMFALAQLADSRDPETGEHLLRMRAYAQLIAEHLARTGPYCDQIDQQFLSDFYRSTPLHDIGKVGIPDQILLKPGPLTRAEFDIMKCHTVIGAEAIEKAARQSSYGGFLTMAADIARHHHERFDGSGYPHGLVGLDIPLSARITAIADVFDALTSPRVYKEPMPPDEARVLIERESGKHFDPAIVDAFRDCYGQFLDVKRQIDGTQVKPIAPLPLTQSDFSVPMSALPLPT